MNENILYDTCGVNKNAKTKVTGQSYSYNNWTIEWIWIKKYF